MIVGRRVGWVLAAEDNLGQGEQGPLSLSPNGCAWIKERLLDTWRPLDSGCWTPCGLAA